MTPLPIGTSKASLAASVVASPRSPHLRTTARFAALLAAIDLPAIAAGAEKEDLPARLEGADDKANRQHGRIARKVGRPAAVMRNLVAITAA